MAKSTRLTKGAKLNASIHAAAGKQQPGPVAVAKKEAPALIQAHYTTKVRRAMKLAEAHSGKNMKQLLGEGINYVCVKYGVPEPYSEEA